MTDRQFVEVRFQPTARRTYTYHNDGPPVAPGDRVKVDGRDGWQEVEVVAIVDEAPPFATKPIGVSAAAQRQGMLLLDALKREQRDDERNRR